MPRFNTTGMKYDTQNKDLLTKYKINYALVAKWFGYSNANSFYGSKAKNEMIKGVINLIKHIENESTHRKK